MSALPALHLDRAAINRANSQHSTGPRTDAGKQRSSLNALRHGLTAQSPVLATEDAAAYQHHCRQFHDDFKPATAAETHLVQELADASWRIHRIPRLEADLLNRAANPPTEQAAIDFDIVDAHRLIGNLSIQLNRLSRQFHKTLEILRDLQIERRQQERRDLKDAAALFVLHEHKGVPWQPSDHGFVFSKEQVSLCAERMMRQNEARGVAVARFEAQCSIGQWDKPPACR
jgi:hypothetical protein